MEPWLRSPGFPALTVVLGVALGAGGAWAQAPSPARPAPVRNDLTRPPLAVPPGLGDAPDAAAVPVTAARSTSTTSGATPRPTLRPPKTRRARSPVAAPFRTGFRSTLAPTGVAPDIQPIQTGVPDVDPTILPARRRPVLVDDPYAPLGVRVGNILLFPVIGQSFGYDTNPNRTQRFRSPSAVSQTEAELGVQSNWSRHELSGNMRGAWNEYFSNPAANRPEGAGNLRFRFDVSRDTQVDAEAHYLIDTQRPGSPELNARVVDRPVVYSEGASIGVTHRFNRLIASLRGTIDRYDYEDAKLPGNVIVDQGDRAFTSYGLRGRLGYEIHPGLIPFVEAFADTRDYDRKLDNSGYARSSDGFGARLGTTFEITRLLSGEVSAGGQVRDYQDRRLGSLVAPIANLALAYAVTPLTTVRATGAASVDETTVLGATGIRTFRGTLEVAHLLRRNIILSAGLRAWDSEYQGVSIHEQGIGGFVRAEYRLNRNVAIRASYSHDNLQSSVQGASYASNVFLLGVRLQP